MPYSDEDHLVCWDMNKNLLRFPGIRLLLCSKHRCLRYFRGRKDQIIVFLCIYFIWDMCLLHFDVSFGHVNLVHKWINCMYKLIIMHFNVFVNKKFSPIKHGSGIRHIWVAVCLNICSSIRIWRVLISATGRKENPGHRAKELD